MDVTFNGCEGGLTPGEVTKVKGDGVGTVVTFNVTVSCSPLFVAPEAASVIVPV